MKYISFCLIPVFLFSACAEAPLKIETAPYNLKAQSSQNAKLVDKTTEMTVRSYVKVANEKGKETRKEVAGAQCTAKSDQLSGKFVTPAKLLMPKFDQDKKLADRGLPGSVLLSCEANAKRGQQLVTAKPGNLYASYSGNLVADLLIITASAAIASTVHWAFPPVSSVELK